MTSVLASLRSWAYSSTSNRDPRLDWIRGYCLFMMIADHIQNRSALYVLTGGTEFYTSAAEAFYFISGLTLGMVTARESWLVASKRVLSRALVLYRTAMIMTLAFGLLGAFTAVQFWGTNEQNKPIFEWIRSDFLGFLTRALTMRSSVGGQEILVLYVLYMLLAPIALFFLNRRLGWLVVLGIFAVYTAHLLQPGLFKQPFAVYFQPYQWQTLFFGGLVLGFHRKDVVSFFAKIPVLSRILEVLVLIAAGVFIWIFANNFAVWPALPALLDLENRWLMPPVQLALVALYLQAAFIVVSYLWKPLQVGLGWFLEPLGRASLWAFTVHWFVYAILVNFKPFVEYTSDRWWWQLLGVGFVWATIKLYGLLMPKKRKPDSSSADALKSRLSSVVSTGTGLLEPQSIQGHADDLSARFMLGVSMDASLLEIRTAYQSKVAQYHPDKLAKLNENLRKLADNEVRAIDGAYMKLIESLDVAGGQDQRFMDAQSSSIQSSSIQSSSIQSSSMDSGLMGAARKMFRRVRSQW
jgi:hypothetical protein